MYGIHFSTRRIVPSCIACPWKAEASLPVTILPGQTVPLLQGWHFVGVLGLPTTPPFSTR